MLRKQWPGDDPVRKHGIEAQKAMQRLYDAVRFSGVPVAPPQDAEAQQL
jgi:hypothetical protein